MSGTVLVTRPAAQAQPLAALLSARGYDPYCEPLLEIVNLPFEIPSSASALVFTSGNGVCAVAAGIAERHHRVFCVGDRTAALAREAGWDRVQSAGGDAASLQKLLHKQEFLPSETVVHCHGFDVSGNLEIKKRPVEKLVVYRAEKRRALSPGCGTILRAGGFAAALFFSPRTAETFTELLATAGLQDSVRATKALCIADSVLKSLHGLPWADVQVAARPTQQAVLALLDPRFIDRQYQDGDDD